MSQSRLVSTSKAAALVVWVVFFFTSLSYAETFEHHDTYTGGVARYFKDVAIGDVDNDGDLDIWGVKLQELEALSDIGDVIFLNQLADSGTLTFMPTFGASVFPNPIQTQRTYDGELGDIDKDGNLDLVRPDISEIYIVFGDGSGVFDGSTAIKVFGAPLAATLDDSVLGDINGDGFLDIIVAEYTSAESSKVFLNLGKPPWFHDSHTVYQELDSGSPADNPTTDTHSVFLSDYDADGHLDAVITGGGSGNAASKVYNWNESTDNFDFVQLLETGEEIRPASMADVADIDRDGIADVFLGYDERGVNHNPAIEGVMLGTGSTANPFPVSGFRALPNASTFSVYDGRIADFDIDGNMDVFLVDFRNSGNIRVFEYTGAPAEPFPEATGDMLTSGLPAADGMSVRLSVDLGDLDNDGDLDAVIGGSESGGNPGAATVYRNTTLSPGDPITPWPGDSTPPTIHHALHRQLPNDNDGSLSFEVSATILDNSGRFGIAQSIDPNASDPPVWVDVAGTTFPILDMGGFMYRAALACEDLSLAADSPYTVHAVDRADNAATTVSGTLPTRLTSNVVHPTGLTPAGGSVVSAGDPGSPGKFFVRVEQKPLIRGLTGANFEVKIDTVTVPTADVVPFLIQDQYWLLIQAPAEPPGDALHDLTVTLNVCNTTRETVVNSAVIYTALPLADNIFVMDRSGSMGSAEKMPSAKNAAAVLINATADGERIGSVWYAGADSSTGLGVAQALSTPPVDSDNTSRGTVIGDIGGLEPSGVTSIGQGIIVGQGELDKIASSSPVRTLYLISDGRENTPPFWDEVPPGVGYSPSPGALKVKDLMLDDHPDTIINTVSLGPDARTELMDEIATLTGGVHIPVALDPEEVMAFSAPSLLEALGVTRSAYAAAAVELNLGNRLADAYRMMGEHALKRQRVWDLSSIALRRPDRGDDVVLSRAPANDVLNAGVNVAAPQNLPMLDAIHTLQEFEVENDFTDATLSVNWGNAALPISVILRDPDGVVVTGAYPGVSIRTTTIHEVFKFAQPKVGRWTIDFIGLKGPSPFVASLDVRTATTLHAFVLALATGYDVGDTIEMVAMVSDRSPVIGANIVGIVRKPGGPSTLVTLSDDGTGSDTQADDGVYSGGFTATVGGGYVVEFVAQGTNNAGNGFRRVAARSAPVRPLDTDGDGLPNAWELANGLNIALDDAFFDPDRDGAVNLVEHYYNTNPREPDTDKGGALDGLEVRVRTDTHDPGDDDEARRDDDGDGVPNRWEGFYGSDPNVADANIDLDGDGLTGLGEWNNGTDPNVADSDGDGKSDGEEVGQGSNPLDVNDTEARPGGGPAPISDGDDDEGILGLPLVVWLLIIVIFLAIIVILVRYKHQP